MFNDRVDLDKVKAILAKERTASVVKFPDVPAALWSAAFVERAALMGIVTGYADGSYHPDAKVTRAEFAAMLVKAFGLTASGGPDSPIRKGIGLRRRLLRFKRME